MFVFADSTTGTGGDPTQLEAVVGGQIRERVHLEVAPDEFDGIELGGVGR